MNPLGWPSGESRVRLPRGDVDESEGFKSVGVEGCRTGTTFSVLGRCVEDAALEGVPSVRKEELVLVFFKDEEDESV